MYDDWIDGISIGHDPLIYIEGGGLIPVGNLSKPYFLSFPRVWNSSDRNSKGQIRTGFSVKYVGSPVGSPDLGRNSRQSELPTFVGTPDVGITPDTPSRFLQASRKSRHPSELPIVGSPNLGRNSRRRDNPKHLSRFLQVSRKSRLTSELSTVRSPDLGRNSRQRGIFLRA